MTVRYIPHCPDDEEAISLTEYQKRIAPLDQARRYWKTYILGGRFNGGSAMFDVIQPIWELEKLMIYRKTLERNNLERKNK